MSPGQIKPYELDITALAVIELPQGTKRTIKVTLAGPSQSPNVVYVTAYCSEPAVEVLHDVDEQEFSAVYLREDFGQILSKAICYLQRVTNSKLHIVSTQEIGGFGRMSFNQVMFRRQVNVQ